MRPAKRPGSELGLLANESVLLLDAEPRFLVSRIENLFGVDAEVSVSRLKLRA